MIYFATSYMLKCYLPERGHAEVSELWRKSDDVVCCEFAKTEFASALHRHFREGRISLDGLKEVLATWRDDQAAGLWGWLQFDNDLSHHGQDPNKIEQLKMVELEKMKTIQELLEKLKKTEEQGESLLDRTMVLFSSNLGNASSHSTKNLPVLLAGGGFQHGQHLAFDPNNPPPLCNLYVSMLQRLGIETDKFGSSTGTLTGLET